MAADENKHLFSVSIDNIKWDCYAEFVINLSLPIRLIAFISANDIDSLINSEIANFLKDEYDFRVKSLDVIYIDEVTAAEDSCPEIVSEIPWGDKEYILQNYAVFGIFDI